MGDEHVALGLLWEAHTSPRKAVSLAARRMCSSEPRASRDGRVNTVSSSHTLSLSWPKRGRVSYVSQLPELV